jgi:hypothetical protein
MNKFCILLFLFVSSVCYSQNEIVFVKQMDTAKTFSLPIDKIPVTIKLYKGKKIRGRISGYKDSTFTIRVFMTDKETRAKTLKVWEDHEYTNAELRRKIDSIQYSGVKQIKVSEVKKIFIQFPIKYRPIPFILFCTGTLAYICFDSFVVTEKNTNIGGIPPALVYVGLAAVTFYFSSKSLSLEHTWRVKGIEKKKQ